jgi:segregation and condensation protein B
MSSPLNIETEPVATEADPTMQPPDDAAAKAESAPSGEPAAEVPGEKELIGILEALLFVSHEPVTLDRLTATIACVPKAEIRQTLLALQQDLERGERGVQLIEIAGGFQLVARQDCAPWIRKLGKTKTTAKLSRSALESLAIIAYKQPIVRSEVEQIRGVETSGVLRTLLERKFVRIVGRKDVAGRPIMYGTTKFFLQHFGLRDLSELPPLREFKELGESDQASLPMTDEPLSLGDPDSTPDA